MAMTGIIAMWNSIDWSDFAQVLNEVSPSLLCDHHLVILHESRLNPSKPVSLNERMEDDFFLSNHAVSAINDAGASSTVESSCYSSRSISSDEQDDGSTTYTSKRISFSTIVEVREYSLTIGDHPHCRGGLALTLDWKYNAKTTTMLSVKRRERTRTELGRHHSSSPKKLNYMERAKRLQLVTGMSEKNMQQLLQHERMLMSAKERNRG